MNDKRDTIGDRNPGPAFFALHYDCLPSLPDMHTASIYSELINLITFCTCGTRWMPTNFLFEALRVIFDVQS